MTNTPAQHEIAKDLAKNLAKTEENLKTTKTVISGAGFKDNDFKVIKAIKGEIVRTRYKAGVRTKDGAPKGGQIEQNQDTINSAVNQSIKDNLTPSQQTKLMAGLGSGSSAAPKIEPEILPEISASYNITPDASFDDKIQKNKVEAKTKEETKAKEETQIRKEAKAKDEAKAKEEEKTKEETKTKEEAKAKDEAKAKEELKVSKKMQAFLATMAGYGGQGHTAESVHAVLEQSGFLDKIADDLDTGDKDITFTSKKVKTGQGIAEVPVININYKDSGGTMSLQQTQGGGLKVTFSAKKFDQNAANDMIAIQKARNAGVLKLGGTKAQKSMLWRAAQAQGMEVDASTYKPSEADKDWLFEAQNAAKNAPKQDSKEADSNTPAVSASKFAKPPVAAPEALPSSRTKALETVIDRINSLKSKVNSLETANDEVKDSLKTSLDNIIAEIEPIKGEISLRELIAIDEVLPRSFEKGDPQKTEVQKAAKSILDLRSKVLDAVYSKKTPQQAPKTAPQNTAGTKFGAQPDPKPENVAKDTAPKAKPQTLKA